MSRIINNEQTTSAIIILDESYYSAVELKLNVLSIIKLTNLRMVMEVILEEVLQLFDLCQVNT